MRFLEIVQVYEFVGLAELFYAGSHGMDIMGPDRASDSADASSRLSDEQVNGQRQARAMAATCG